MDIKKVIVTAGPSTKVLQNASAIDIMKRFLFEGEDVVVSDGYHTFEDLYEHRITLFIALCQAIKTLGAQPPYSPEIWRSKLHSDGSSYDGWFIMGIGKDAGQQMSYHLPISKWEETDFAETLEQAPVFDGHTPFDVIARLKDLFNPDNTKIRISNKNMPEKELTYGERAVGLTFNLSNDPTVQKIKELYAEIIDLVNQIPCASPSERMRLIKIAITEAQGAQMWAVKAATWQEAVLAEAGKEEGEKPETLEEAISKDEVDPDPKQAAETETPTETETPAAEVPEGEEGEKQE